MLDLDNTIRLYELNPGSLFARENDPRRFQVSSIANFTAMCECKDLTYGDTIWLDYNTIVIPI